MLRFTIRDALWLMVTVGISCGWAVHSHQLAARAKVAEFRTGELEGWIDSWGEPVVWNGTKTKIVRPPHGWYGR